MGHPSPTFLSLGFPCLAVESVLRSSDQRHRGLHYTHTHPAHIFSNHPSGASCTAGQVTLAHCSRKRSLAPGCTEKRRTGPGGCPPGTPEKASRSSWEGGKKRGWPLWELT